MRKASDSPTLSQFCERIGIVPSTLSMMERGLSNPSNQTILAICREFGVNETWLRTGVGEPYAHRTREEELGDLIGELMSDSPDSFRTRLITALLRFKPNSEEWKLLENIYNSVAAEQKKEPDT